MTPETSKRPVYFQNCVAGFSQEKLLELGMDLTDAHIFQWLLDFMGSGKMTMLKNPDGSIFRENGRVFYWVKYQAIANTFPIFGITTIRGISKRFDRYIENGLLHRKLITTAHGKANYFAITDKLLDLKFSDKSFALNSSSSVQANSSSSVQANSSSSALNDSPDINSPKTNSSLPPNKNEKKINEAFVSIGFDQQRPEFIRELLVSVERCGLPPQQVPEFLFWLKKDTDKIMNVKDRRAFFFHRLLKSQSKLLAEYQSVLASEVEKRQNETEKIKFLKQKKICPACGYEHPHLDSCCPICGITEFEENDPVSVEEHKKMQAMPKETRIAMESELEQKLRESFANSSGKLKEIMATKYIFDQVYKKYGIRQSKEVTDDKGSDKTGIA